MSPCSAPRLSLAPRTGAAAAVATVHVFALAALLLVPQVRDGRGAPAPLFAHPQASPRAPLPAMPARSIPFPALAGRVRVPPSLPTITLAAEAVTTPVP